MLTFNNTKIAFSNKTDYELKKAFWLFKTIESPKIVSLGSKLLNLALNIHFPVKWIIKPTVFTHFCGGETIAECDSTIIKLGKSGIGTILDYSAEGIENETDFDNVTEELLEVIKKSINNQDIPFAVFKVTGIARFEILEKLNSNESLSNTEQLEYERVLTRIDKICYAAFQNNIPVFIDAEETWIQNTIDGIAENMIRKYNTKKAIVYNTLQLYRHDRISYLENMISEARKHNYHIGIKIVRGAYMEKERERAQKLNYPSPIQKDKESTDKDYDKALKISFDNMDVVSVCAGSHNEKSNMYLTELIKNNNLNLKDKRFYFAQLLGMSDHISYNLSNEGFNVAKYVPYGPVNSVMPYLLRRAQENTSVAGQTGRELMLITNELKRRKQTKI
jgi:proline dehydrogenase